MFNIENSPFLKYYLFGSLYFTEGLFMAIAFVIIPVYFAEKNIDLPTIGLVIGIASIPVIVKFIWGVIADYYAKYGRKRFIILGGTLFSIGTIILTIIDPADMLPIFTIFLFISVIGIGFLDVSADAWAIAICKKEEFGKVNGAMFAGQYAGMAIGTSAFAIIADQYNYSAVFLIAGILLFIIILTPLLVKETIRITKRQKVASMLITEFRKPTIQLLSLFAVFSMVNRGLLFVVIPLYMKIGLFLDIAQIGLIIALFPITSALGSIIGGIMGDKIQRKTALYLFVIISMILSASLITAITWQILAILYSAIGLLQGCYTACEGAMFMDNTNPKIGATQFSVFMGIGNGGMTLGESFSGVLVATFGFASTFLYSAWFFGPVLLILHFIRYEKKKKR
jgi:MFS family permease